MGKSILFHVPSNLKAVDPLKLPAIYGTLVDTLSSGKPLKNLTQSETDLLKQKMLPEWDSGRMDLTETLLAQLTAEFQSKGYTVSFWDEIHLPHNLTERYDGVISAGATDQELPHLIVKGNASTADHIRTLLPEDDIALWQLVIVNGQIQISSDIWLEEKARFLQALEAKTQKTASLGSPMPTMEKTESCNENKAKDLKNQYIELLCNWAPKLEQMSFQLQQSAPEVKEGKRAEYVNGLESFKKELTLLSDKIGKEPGINDLREKIILKKSHIYSKLSLLKKLQKKNRSEQISDPPRSAPRLSAAEVFAKYPILADLLSKPCLTSSRSQKTTAPSATVTAAQAAQYDQLEPPAKKRRI